MLIYFEVQRQSVFISLKIEFYKTEFESRIRRFSFLGQLSNNKIAWTNSCDIPDTSGKHLHSVFVLSRFSVTVPYFLLCPEMIISGQQKSSAQFQFLQ